MKTILLLLFPILCFCQTETIEVYETTNGIKELTPSKIIEVSKDKTYIYETTNGLKDLTPSQVVEDNKVYNTTNGIQNITPALIIKPKTDP